MNDNCRDSKPSVKSSNNPALIIEDPLLRNLTIGVSHDNYHSCKSLELRVNFTHYTRGLSFRGLSFRGSEFSRSEFSRSEFRELETSDPFKNDPYEMS